MAANAVETEVSPIEIFWMPGCSSCLRMKEFMEKTGLGYHEINLVESPQYWESLSKMGLGVPAVVVGDHGVPGLDLVAVAELIGFDYTPPVILEPAVLKARYDTVIDALAATIGQLPVEALEYKSPDRDRTLRELAAHASTIMLQFLEAYEGEFFADAFEGPKELREHGLIDDLVAQAHATVAQFDTWWDTLGYDDPLDRVLETRYPEGWGYRKLHEALEREVWHTAQHTRQIQLFAERLGIVLELPLTEDDLKGLPLPERVQA